MGVPPLTEEQLRQVVAQMAALRHEQRGNGDAAVAGRHQRADHSGERRLHQFEKCQFDCKAGAPRADCRLDAHKRITGAHALRVGRAIDKRAQVLAQVGDAGVVDVLHLGQRAVGVAVPGWGDEVGA